MVAPANTTVQTVAPPEAPYFRWLQLQASWTPPGTCFTPFLRSLDGWTWRRCSHRFILPLRFCWQYGCYGSVRHAARPQAWCWQ